MRGDHYYNLSRIVEEKILANCTKICYTYDSLSRVTNRTIKNECEEVISSENYSYDAAGNITDAPDSCFEYDTNNRLITFNGNTVSYDMDGNMLSNGYLSCEFDSGNRLTKAGGHTYTYNAEDVRIRNLCADADTTYTYNTNCKLSQLLCKTTNGVTTKYVYGLGLIGEEKHGCFKIYHFDYRGSTVAITDECGNITDTFKYDTYGKLISRTGSNFVIFGYNGRDGVVTDKNGLIYMRARYYSPDMRRFVNADILHGEISDSTSLNRYSYVNGNPVSFVDPFGLWSLKGAFNSVTNLVKNNSEKIFKVATSVAVVATLAVVTVATAGTATEVIAGGALIGATVGGTIGAATGYINGGIDGAINGMFVGTISGAASGGLGASGASSTAVAIGNIAVSVGETYLEDYVDDGKINETDAWDIAFAVGTGAVGADDGLLHGKHLLYPSSAIFRNSLKNDFIDYTAMTFKGEVESMFTDELYEEVRRSK